MQWSSRRAARTLLCASLGLATAGCLAHRAAQLRQRLVGLPAAAIERCLGTPSTLDELDGRAVWLYEAMYSGPPEQATIEIAQGTRAAALPPRVIARPAAADALLGPQDRATRDAPVPRVTCVLVFELEGGVVRRFRSAGRSPGGANATSECALLAGACVPLDTAAEAPR